MTYNQLLVNKLPYYLVMNSTTVYKVVTENKPGVPTQLIRAIAQGVFDDCNLKQIELPLSAVYVDDKSFKDKIFVIYYFSDDFINRPLDAYAVAVVVDNTKNIRVFAIRKPLSEASNNMEFCEIISEEKVIKISSLPNYEVENFGVYIYRYLKG